MSVTCPTCKGVTRIEGGHLARHCRFPGWNDICEASGMAMQSTTEVVPPTKALTPTQRAWRWVGRELLYVAAFCFERSGGTFTIDWKDAS